MSGPDTIAIRAYTELARPKPRSLFRGNDAPSDYHLTFDCETTTDARQRLRFGVYQKRRAGLLKELGLFYDPDGVSAAELTTLQTYAAAKGMKYRSVTEFINEVFYRIGYDRRGTIVGFNLPFDISRIAIAHGEARGSMRGGFTFKLAPFANTPNVRVKHLSRRAALIDFAVPAVQETPRDSLRRGIKMPPHRGFFVDVSTLASALMSDGFSLASLCKRLNTPTQKQEGAEHGAALSEAYLDYACADVQSTWECFETLRDQYASHNLSTPIHRIFSEASIGKGYLRQMGIEPLLSCAPDIPRDIFGKIMSAYYGGRSEMHWRREIKRVLYCDFKSMYPTVNALMGLWRFVVADGMKWRDGTEEARQILGQVSLETYRQPEAWKALTCIVRIQPDHDLMPVRAKYDGRINTIGLNHLTYAGDLWLTLADCIAAKILSGKAPMILEALCFEPGPPQQNLQAVELFGNSNYRVDPAREDVFARLVDLRDEAKSKADPLQQAIKIIANATSYGIFIEVIRDDAPKAELVAVYGPSGDRHVLRSRAIEQPGGFFHPLLGVLITGAARLMLALAERRVLDAGLDWAFCDTDSIAIVAPDDMPEPNFLARCTRVVDWFEQLNPYQRRGSILKIEDHNFALDASGQLTDVVEPLYCFGVSAKRYALFNIDDAGVPIIRKASAHGLGHLLAPYGAEAAPADIPPPAMPPKAIEVSRWQYDLWFKIISAALAKHPHQVSLDYHPALSDPALTRFGLSSPSLERWMSAWNKDKAYAERARAFGFMVTFQAGEVSNRDAVAEFTDRPKRGRPRRRPTVKPIAPFDRASTNAVKNAFDRETGQPVSAAQLKTYTETLVQFHLHPEDKFSNGDYTDRGRTERRHVVASGVRLIGKEANKWEERSNLIDDRDDVVGFGRIGLGGL